MPVTPSSVSTRTRSHGPIGDRRRGDHERLLHRQLEGVDVHGGDLHLRRSAGRVVGCPQSMSWAVRARSPHGSPPTLSGRRGGRIIGPPAPGGGVRDDERRRVMTDAIQFERHTETAGVLQPARRDGVRRGPHRGAHRPAHRHDGDRLGRPRGQGGDVPRQDRLGLRRGARGAQPRGLLLLPREGARGDAALPGRARARRAARARRGARLPQPLPARRRPRRRHLPGEALPAAERVHARACSRRALGAALDFAGRAERFYPA